MGGSTERVGQRNRLQGLGGMMRMAGKDIVMALHPGHPVSRARVILEALYVMMLECGMSRAGFCFRGQVRDANCRRRCDVGTCRHASSSSSRISILIKHLATIAHMHQSKMI